jgi:DNA-binding MarR family transcriptional regulator
VKCQRPSAAVPRPEPAPRLPPAVPLPPLAELPPGQRRLLDALVAALEAGQSPTLRQLADVLGVRLNAAYGHVQRLTRKGWLTHGGGARQVALSPAARAALRGARPEAGHVLLALYAPAERLTPRQARELARALDAAAGAVEGAGRD